MSYRPAHLAAAGITTVASLFILAPAAHAETSPSYHCKTIKPGKSIGDNLAPVAAAGCTSVNEAPTDGAVTGFFFIIDLTKKGAFYVCGVNPDGKFAPDKTQTGTATLPDKVKATGCKAFPKGKFKFTPEQFEGELAKQAEAKGTAS
ncbi:hypothetical protein OG203_37485 [Nocardia sp. NBC_01499]|uniref:hypothetical protein n=1 Tax=Nocardia sp. NBC_01499 TaxID=2903597 RepID=UPI003867DFB7